MNVRRERSIENYAPAKWTKPTTMTLLVLLMTCLEWLLISQRSKKGPAFWTITPKACCTNRLTFRRQPWATLQQEISMLC